MTARGEGGAKAEDDGGSIKAALGGAMVRCGRRGGEEERCDEWEGPDSE